MKELMNSLQTIWKDLTIGQRITLIGSVALVFVAIGSLVYFMNKPNLSLLFGELEASETGKVIEYLKTNKITYDIKGTSIYVPEEKVGETRLALVSQGIPKSSDAGGGVGFELLDKQNFGLSDFMQKANYQRALQGELARTIKKMEEIDEARVMIVSPEDRLFRPTKQEAKASVFLKLKVNRTLSEEKIQAIRFLVANSIEHLSPERVAIVDNFGRSLAPDQQSGSLASVNANQLTIQKQIEESLREKAQSMLDRVLGPGQSVVKISADVDFDAVQETTEKFDPDGQVLRGENSTMETTKSETPVAGGSAGTTENLEQKAKQANTTSEQLRKTTDNKYEIGRTVSMRNRASGSVKRLSIAVTVNSMPFSMGGAKPTAKAGATTPAELPPKRTQQELDSLGALVKNAVGYTANDQRKDAFSITEQPFADLFAAAPDDASMITGILTQSQNWGPIVQQGFLILLAIGLFFYLWSVMKASTVKDEPEGAFADLIKRFEDMEKKSTMDLEELTANGNGNGNGKSSRRAGTTVVGHAILTSDEMGQLIRENPGNATQAIKKWMTKN